MSSGSRDFEGDPTLIAFWRQSTTSTKQLSYADRVDSLLDQLASDLADNHDTVVHSCRTLTHLAASTCPESFAASHMRPNVPALIAKATENWPASTDLVTNNDTLHVEQLQARFGSSRVSVTDTATNDGYGAGRVLDMTLADYLAWWEQRDDRLLYLKDWHLIAEYRHVYNPYLVPEQFRDDWLNDWLVAESSGGGNVATADYRFVYLGPRGSWTPLHADVLRSYSWSANIVGEKQWWLLHPRFTFLLYDKHGKQLAPSLFPGSTGKALLNVQIEQHDCVETLLDIVTFLRHSWRTDPSDFPLLPLARQLALVVHQPAGSALFVPSGWHHFVLNITDVLSINHNWLNGFNVSWALQLLRREYQVAASLLDDCRALSDYTDLVERNVKANCGMCLADIGANGMLGWVAARAMASRNEGRLIQMRDALRLLLDLFSDACEEGMALHLEKEQALLDRIQDDVITVSHHV